MKLSKLLGILIFFIFIQIKSISQPCISGIINNYSNITQFDCGNSIQITDPFKFKVGDLILIYQTKLATNDTSNDTLQYGNVLSYNSTGQYEYNRIKKIVGNKIFLTYISKKKFIVNDYLQIISVPEYTDVRICSPGIRSDVWDGKKGGILALSVSGKLIFENDIDVSGNGFRGGNRSLANSSYGVTTEHIGDLELGINSDKAAQKGEGIGTIDFKSGRGKWANGGGGGNLHNGGGAGGGNGGNGGFGGNGCELCYGYKEIARGIGGSSLIYSNSENRIFLGGGGGGGHRNGVSGSNGADGGGIVIIKANEIIGNNRTIKANGANANPSFDDGAGAGGAGGTVLLDVKTISGNLTVNVKGGNGGSILSGNDGPGGGGSGGVVWSSTTLNSNITNQFTGGNAGVRLNNGSNFGAKNGDNGLIIYDLNLPIINENYEYPPLNFSTINPKCFGDSIGNITFQNLDYKYSFNNQPFTSSRIYSNLKGGNYLFSIMYDTINQCKYDTIISIIDNNTLLTSAVTILQNEICDQKGSVLINTIGGLPPYSNELNNFGNLPTSTFKNLEAGNYLLTTIDSKGCRYITNFDIEDKSYKINLTIDKITDKSCKDTGSVQFKVQNSNVNYNLFINNLKSPNFNFLNPGSYFSYVIDSFGCKSDTLPFTIVDRFKNYNFTKKTTLCEGDTLLFDNQIITSSGLYSFDFKTSENCDSVINLEINLLPKTFYSTKKEICFGENITIGNQIFNQTGIYNFKIKNHFGCDSIISLDLKVEKIETNLKHISNYHGQIISCNGKSDGSLGINPIGGTSPYQILWSNNSYNTTISNLSKGKYWVRVTSQTGCMQSDTIELFEPNNITWDIETKPIVCNGDQNGEVIINQMFGGNGKYFFSIEGSDYFEAISFPWIYNHLFAGVHQILVKDENGCNSEFNSYIPDKPKFEIELSQLDTIIQFGDSLIISVISKDALHSIKWFPGKYTSCDTCSTTFVKPISDFIQIYAIAKNTDGCKDTSTILIKTKSEKKIFVPNIFYPESSNLQNQYFKIFGSNDVENLSYLLIFDRWGNLIYEENNTPLQSMIGWDGTSNGKKLNNGIYIYQAEVNFRDGTKRKLSGDVYLSE